MDTGFITSPRVLEWESSPRSPRKLENFSFQFSNDVSENAGKCGKFEIFGRIFKSFFASGRIFSKFSIFLSSKESSKSPRISFFQIVINPDQNTKFRLISCTCSRLYSKVKPIFLFFRTLEFLSTYSICPTS